MNAYIVFKGDEIIGNSTSIKEATDIATKKHSELKKKNKHLRPSQYIEIWKRVMEFK